MRLGMTPVSLDELISLGVPDGLMRAANQPDRKIRRRRWRCALEQSHANLPPRPPQIPPSIELPIGRRALSVHGCPVSVDDLARGTK